MLKEITIYDCETIFRVSVQAGNDTDALNKAREQLEDKTGQVNWTLKPRTALVEEEEA